jgi:hypothetical protein
MTLDRSPVPSASAAGLLTIVAVLAAAAAGAVILGWGRPRHLEAVGFAAVVCLAVAVGGWLVARRATGGPATRVGGSLGVVLVRTFPALLALGWLQAGGHGLRDAGAGGLLVAFYLVVLAGDVILNIMGTNDKPPAPGGKSLN